VIEGGLEPVTSQHGDDAPHGVIGDAVRPDRHRADAAALFIDA